MKAIALSLLLIGSGIMLYPAISDYYGANQQKQLLDSFKAHAQNNQENVKLEYSQLNRTFNGQTSNEIEDATTSSAIGIIEIDKINLQVPIVEGVTQSDLKFAAGYMPGTSKIGEQGNAAIAAHRSFTYGELFNRLDELGPDDHISISLPSKDLTYKVTDKFLVKPEDLSVLAPEQNESVITLITCHPMKNPTHRLIVKAVLDKQQNS